MFDRTGKVELAKLGSLRREVVTYDQIPGEMIDATTAIEDQDFWQNAGFDPVGIISAGVDTISGRPRGASTITQQLVRARLLPDWAFEGSTYERKVREIIQSVRLTQAYPGQAGKEQIITAYLNQNFYGNNSYGVKAAARGYFGKALSDLTLAQYAILAAIPKSPTQFDLVKNADEVCKTEVADDADCPAFDLVVPDTSDIVQRRNHVLDLMKTHSTLTGSKHTLDEYDAAKQEPVVLTLPASASWKAPQFVWQVRRALAEILCPDTPTDCPQVDTGGYTVTTTLDYTMQKVAEKWVYAAARAPNASDPRSVLRARKIPTSAWNWILGLRGHNLNNAAAGVIDYRTGQVLAYVGSASYTAKGNKQFQPQFDVMADGWRQPGSSIKPVDYAIGIDDGTLTAATVFMDVDDRLRGRLPADAGRQARARPRPAPVGPPVLAQHPGHQGGDHDRPGPPLRPDQGPGAHLSEHRRAGEVDGHRHARGAPDRPAGRLRSDRQQRPQDAAPVHHLDRGLERADHLAAGRRQAAGRAGAAAREPPTSSRTSWPETRTRRSTRSGASGPSRTARRGARRPTRPARRATTATWPRTATWRRPRIRRRRRTRSACGWATATTRPTTASSRSTPPRHCGRPS